MSVVYASINSLLQHAKEADAQAQKRKNEDVDESGSKKRRLGELTSTTEIIDCAPVQSRDRVQQKQGQANRKSYKDRKNPNRTRSNVIFEHGNYLDYYGYRNKGYRGFDPRLEVMDASWFVGAKCLDVGCNAGIFTLDLAVLFDIGSILGVDIDQKLITKAKGNLVKYQKLADNSRIMPDSAIQPQHQAQTETEQTGSQNTDSNVSSQTTTNIQQEVNAKKRLLTDYVSFRHEDYTKAPTTPDSYNIITCMSVLKWIHINTGDDGIRAVFKKFCAEIKEGGYLIIEPQPWSSYKPKKLTTEGKAAYKALKLRPDDFDGLLKTEGFSFVFSGKPETSIGGFSCREIRVYQKKTPSILTS